MDKSHMGVGELIMVLMTLGGFGVAHNGHAPSAAEVSKFAPDDADYLMYADVESLVQPNYTYFTKLIDDPAVQAIPELALELSRGIRHMERQRAQVKQMIGFDPITDVKSVALWFSMPAEMGVMPEVAFALRGKFPADVIERGAQAAGAGTTEKVDGRSIWLGPAEMPIAIGLAADGTALVGSPAWVRSRMASGWKGGAKKGSISDRAAATLDDKPVFLIASKPSATTTAMIESQMRDPEAAIFRDLLTGHDFMALALRANGVSWMVTAKTAAGYGRATLATDGAIQLMRSGHFFMRGLADVALAAVETYASDSTIANVVAHKADLLKLVATFSGDGNFNAQVDKKESTRTVSAKLSGKTLSEVLPATAMVLPGAMAFLLLRSGGKAESRSMEGPARMETAQPIKATPSVAPAPHHP